ncbi:DNA polymerase delta subunit 4-like [Babylonia areolata]|uniref:DNA polymerase delta subunit 4-like n=1 Tax=Babylonia areolata TaxID=304850 RepID=UPI003FD59F5D
MTSKTISDVYKQKKPNRPIVKGEDRPATKVKHDVASSSDEEVLKDFDLTLEYGPCVGISRLERWQRAHKHGLNPPAKVRDLILKHPDDASYTHSLWRDYNI